MELYQLEYFLEAARQPSFTRAAARLNLAQAALSEQMRKLEAELGTELFRRARRGTNLTAAGETLRSHAESLLAQAALARKSVRDLVELDAGRLVVASVPSVSAIVLPAAIAAFRRKHPGVEFALLEGTTEEVAQWVDSGRAEFGVVQLPAPRGDFTITPLFEEAFVLLVPRGHPFASGRAVRVSELAGEGFVFYKGRVRDTALLACRAAGFEPRIVCESGELGTIHSLVAAGLGVALLPELAVRGAGPRCSVGVLHDRSLRRRIALLHSRGRLLGPAGAEFRRLVQATTATAYG